MKVNMSVKKTFIGTVLLFLFRVIVNLGLTKDKKLLTLANKLLCNDRVYKIKVANGRWEKLRLSDYKITLENGDRTNEY